MMMGSSLEKLFIDFDLFYPTQNTGFTTWGKNGVKLLNRIKNAVNERLEELAYSQIFMPSVFNKSYYERYIGNEKKNNLLVSAIYNQSDDLVLKPFSELIYADFLIRNVLENDRYSDYQKIFQWGLCFLNELHPNLCLNCNELTKCEIFSIHDDDKTAEVTWNELNKCLYKICIEDFRVYPLFGYRPGVSAFPSSRDTFAAEISLGKGDFQTLLVSHIMLNDFLSKSGFSEFSNKILCSACFSQKMIAGVLLHHRDQYGFRYPSRLAPTIGMIISQNLLDQQFDDHRVMVYPYHKNKDMKEMMIKEGTVWLIQEADNQSGSSKWLLYQRGDLEKSPVELDSFAEAYQKAKLYLPSYDKQLFEESRRKVLDSMLEISAYHQYYELQNMKMEVDKPNIFIPCCDKDNCQLAVIKKVKWIPKLIYLDVPGLCIECGADTSKGIMFEQKEMYTSFYIPKER